MEASTLESNFAPATLEITPQRIVVIEDHSFLRGQLIEFLNRQPGLICSGQAGTPEEVFPAIEAASPALAILDLRLGDFEMLQMLPRLRNAFPWLYIVVLTQYNTDGFRELAIQAGADAFLLKAEATSKLAAQIQLLLASNQRSRIA